VHEAALAAEAVYWNMQKASQSLRPQAQRKFRAFFPMTCASEKILLGSQTCERKRVRCGEPLSPPQTNSSTEWGLFESAKSGTT